MLAEIATRHVLIGEAPSRDGQWNGLQIKLARKAAGWKREDGDALEWLAKHHVYLCRFCHTTIHVNLLHRYPGADGRGSAFPLAEARRAAESLARLWAALRRGPQIAICAILAGRRVARAFGIDPDALFFESCRSPVFLEAGVRIVTRVVPHPSGVNRWWNDPRNVIEVYRFLEDLGVV